MAINKDTLIIGAGVGGLAAACWAKQKGITFLGIEFNSNLSLNLKNGVHYLHSEPELPFDSELKSITLTDGILKENGIISHTPNLCDALEYSEKVREIQHPSSIFEIGKESRAFVPKSNNLDDLILAMSKYIGEDSFTFSSEVCSIDPDAKYIWIKENGVETRLSYQNIISTIPMTKLLKLAPFLTNKPEFYSNPIQTLNIKTEKIVPNWLINLYVPSKKEKIYRASILNGTMSVESIEKLNSYDIINLKKLFNMFHIDISNPKEYEWKQGKIISISIDERREILEFLIEKNIYPIGRFGLWNNKILIDATISQAKSCIDCIAETIGKKELIKKLSL